MTFATVDFTSLLLEAISPFSALAAATLLGLLALVTLRVTLRLALRGHLLLAFVTLPLGLAMTSVAFTVAHGTTFGALGVLLAGMIVVKAAVS